MDKIYIRDKRSPKPKNENVSRVMSANKGKDTKPELLLRKALWKNGLRGYRLNYKKVPGRPDIAFPSKKIAIFVHGCFWHRCPTCDLPLPKNNVDFWEEKFKKNLARDKQKLIQLKEKGWYTLVIWECKLKHGLEKAIMNIENAFNFLNV
ncbi:MAG TPA: very short patch repair endonuclease [Parafilimonas sp.]|nr:very short patch repair endonuclease [Parafilimonas sp.]